MFSRKEKPLPQPVFQAIPQSKIDSPQSSTEGIFLGEECYWNPAALPNGHVVAIGASGSGKTQTLKAIAFSLRQTYPDIQIFVIDFHGDQERNYRRNLLSLTHGISSWYQSLSN